MRLPKGRKSKRHGMGALLAGLLILPACNGGGGEPASEADPVAEKRAVEATIRKSVAAENAKDADTFLPLWTDKGLKDYDVGSRQDVKSGSSENFGSDRVMPVKFSRTSISGDTASSTVDALVGEHKFAKPLFRVKIALVRQGEKWRIDGFEFLGGPPPPAGATVVDVEAVDYAFAVQPGQAPGNLAFKFTNTGKEHHEMSFFKAPPGVDATAAKGALENIDGRELRPLPAGYEAEHLTFAEPGKSVDVSFAEPIGAGNYYLVCYVPQGGFTEEGQPKNPQGTPHVKLGMISQLSVT